MLKTRHQEVSSKKITPFSASDFIAVKQRFVKSVPHMIESDWHVPHPYDDGLALSLAKRPPSQRQADFHLLVEA